METGGVRMLHGLNDSYVFLLWSDTLSQDPGAIITLFGLIPEPCLTADYSPAAQLSYTPSDSLKLGAVLTAVPTRAASPSTRGMENDCAEQNSTAIPRI